MKIRNGFVSNSSSSSFCIYGVCVSKEDLLSCEEIVKKGIFEEKWGDEIDYSIEKIGLECQTPGDYCENYYIGIEWSSVKDDETGSQFKNRVEALVKPLLKNPNAPAIFGTYQEAWYNG